MLSYWSQVNSWLELETPEAFLNEVRVDLREQGLKLLEGSEGNPPAGAEWEIFVPVDAEGGLRLAVPAEEAVDSKKSYRGLISWIEDRHRRLSEAQVHQFHQALDGFLHDFPGRTDSHNSPHLFASAVAGLFERHFDVRLSCLGLHNSGRWRVLHGYGNSEDFPGAERLKEARLPLQKQSRYWFPITSAEEVVGLAAFDRQFWPPGHGSQLTAIFDRLANRLNQLEDGADVPRHELYELEDSIDLNPDQVRTSRGLDSILQSFVDIIYEMFDCDVCRLFWRESEHELRLRASTPDQDEVTVNADEDPLIQSVLSEGKGVLMNNPAETETDRGSPGGFRSFISVPLRLENRVIGTVNISSERANSYTQSQVSKLSNFCDRLAGVYSIALDLANLSSYVEELLLELPVGVLNVRPGTSRVILNPVARELLTISSARLSYDEFLDHLDNELDCDKLKEIIQSGQETDLAGPVDVELNSDQAQPTIVSALSSSVKNVAGEVVGTLVVLTDVTEQRMLSRQISRTERLTALGELASSLAHEIKTPLTSIHGFVQMVPDRLDDQEFLENMAEVVQRETGRLNSLVENLLSFGKPQVEERSRVRPLELLEDVEVLIEKKLQEKQIDYTVDLSEDLSVYGDGAKLKQVFMNLLLNSIDAVEEGGKIEVNGRQVSDKYVSVEFIDDGAGMDEETQSKLFNPFFTTKKEGSGLGLAITHRIIDEHAGEIDVDSAPGAGTHVRLTLPVSSPRENANSSDEGV